MKLVAVFSCAGLACWLTVLVSHDIKVKLCFLGAEAAMFLLAWLAFRHSDRKEGLR